MLLAFVVVSPFALALLAPFIYRAARANVGKVIAPFPLILFVALASTLGEIARGSVVSVSYPWMPALDIDFSLYLDGLSLLFALLITGIGFLVIVYSVGYLGPREDLGKFYLYILLFMGSMLGVVLASNLILLYIFWELTSVASFLLIGFWYTRYESRFGAQKSLLITVVGGLGMLAGFVLLGTITGSFSIPLLLGKGGELASNPFYAAVLVLILLGAFTKSAQVPFHIWLPNAMEAPTPVSAYLHSATMVKAGLYLLARLTPLLAGTHAWFYLVGGIGILSLTVGGYLAIRQRDLKAMMAFSTISQLGLITSALGMGTPEAVAAGLFHIINHAAFKGGLFLTVGIVDHETGTRDITRLGGLVAFMPFTAAFALAVSLGLAGIPPLNGFLSKEMFFAATVEKGVLKFVGPAFAALAVLASAFTLAYALAYGVRVFFGRPPASISCHVHEAPPSMLAPAGLLAAATLLVGLVPGPVVRGLLEPAVGAVLGRPVHVEVALWHGLNLPLLMSAVSIALGLLMYSRFEHLRRTLDMILPRRLNMNKLYELGLEGLNVSAVYITYKQMTGFLRDYIIFIMAFVIVTVAATIGLLRDFNFTPMDLAPTEIYEYILSAVMIGGSFAVIRSRNRLAAILATGSVGFSVSIMFVIFRAPDLALTQLLVESVTLILFLLAFYHLPQFKEEKDKLSTRAFNALAAVGSGALVTALMIMANANRLYPSIASYFVENSLKLAGGRNIVNVILVDFRGYDTMGEITVLGIAAMSVFALVKLRKRGKPT